MASLMERFVHDEAGSSAIEYGLVAAILGLALVLSFAGLKTALIDLFGVMEAYVPEG
jgi:pilus assembly protein Flp/PilA